MSRNDVVDALENLGLAAEVHGVVAVRYCHDTTGRALTAKVRDAFAKVALRVRLADGSETGEGDHAGLIYTYGGQLRRCALPRRYDGSHGVPPDIWERERSGRAAVAKGVRAGRKCATYWRASPRRASASTSAPARAASTTTP